MMGPENIGKDYKSIALGIDPGLAATGYAVVGTLDKRGDLCCWGSLKTSSRSSHSERLHIIYREVGGLIDRWRPDILVMEDVYVLDRFPKAALQLGEVRGVIYLSAWDYRLDIMKIRPTEVKSCLAGNGRATKAQVSMAVRRALSVEKEIRPDHASDAAALAIIGLSRKGFFCW